MALHHSVVVNGWRLFAHGMFLDQLESLIAEVERLAQKDPKNYKQKNASKRLAAIVELIFVMIPQDPTRPQYRMGNALGNEHTHWFRAKFFQQYRLFFRFHLESKIIVYAWVNDEGTKRAYESKNDAYRIFKKMLGQGCPPDNWDALLNAAKAENNRLGKIADNVPG